MKRRSKRRRLPRSSSGFAEGDQHVAAVKSCQAEASDLLAQLTHFGGRAEMGIQKNPRSIAFFERKNAVETGQQDFERKAASANGLAAEAEQRFLNAELLTLFAVISDANRLYTELDAIARFENLINLQSSRMPRSRPDPVSPTFLRGRSKA